MALGNFGLNGVYQTAARFGAEFGILTRRQDTIDKFTVGLYFYVRIFRPASSDQNEFRMNTPNPLGLCDIYAIHRNWFQLGNAFGFRAIHSVPKIPILLQTQPKVS